MNVYTVGAKKFRAHSEMACKDSGKELDHEPHTWDSQYVLYGPYFCKGYPGFTPKHRADVEPQ